MRHIPLAILAAFICTTAALCAEATQNPLPVPMPDFMTPAQLAKWRTDLAAKVAAADKVQTSDSTSQGLNSGVPTPLAPQKLGAASQSNQLPPVAGFYTGKPYLAESESYIFKYRDYNPGLNRWTTVDPSGFPDGANNRVYAAVPTGELDPDGQVTLAVTDDGNGSPANHANTTFTWAWSISHNGQVVLSGGSSQSATASYVNQNISQFGGITVPSANVGQAYTFEFYQPGAISYHSSAQTFYTSATQQASSNYYGSWQDTGWSITALAFDSFGNNSYTNLNNQPNSSVNNGVKLLSNSNIGGGIDSYLVHELSIAGFTNASSDSDKFYVGGRGGSYNE